MNDVYINILIESLREKSRLLDELFLIDVEQSRVLMPDKPDRDAVDENLQKSVKIAEEINGLDDGFESVYKKVRSELIDNSVRHKKEIALLKELISEVTEKSVKIMATENRNRDAASEKFVFSTKKARSTVHDAASVSGKYKTAMKKVMVQE